jgi:hypothetical protein
MRKLASVLILSAVFILAAAFPALAQNKVKSDLAHALVGTWRITGISALDLETKKVSYPYGEHPIGYIQYSPGGHMVTYMTSGDTGRAKPPYTDADRAAIHKGIIAGYAGTYSVQGNKITHHIIVAYRPDYVGDQTRFVALTDNKLTITTAPIPSNLTGKPTVATLTFVRVE